MTESAPTETCDCPRDDHPCADRRCVNPSVRSEDPDCSALARYSECGCCMADCPDLHPTPTPGFGPVPGSAVLAAEYVATLPADKQQELRDKQARDQLRIVPQVEMQRRVTRRPPRCAGAH